MKRVTFHSLLAVFTVCLPFLTSTANAAIPLVMNHQGRISVGSTPFNGVGAFRFALVDSVSGTNLWTNDGSGIGTSQPPVAAISLTVTDGVYNVGLGNVSLPGMEAALPSTVFDTAGINLRIWFDDGMHGSQYLTPDQPVNSGAYAFHALKSDDADTLDGVHASDISSEIATAMATHEGDTATHVNIELDASRITTGTISSARIPDNWVNASGDIMTGRLVINEAISQPLIEVTNASTTAIQGTSNYSFGNAVRGLASGTQGRGMYGESTSVTNNINYGGYFVARGYQGRGVYAEAASEETYTKYGGEFYAKGGNGIGCRGVANGSNGKGVYGYATNEGDVTNFGGYFWAKGTTGYGVYASGKAYGVYAVGASGGYDFYAAGAGVNYGPFTGAHEARIAPDSPALIPGMVVSVTGAASVRTDEKGNPSLSSTLPEITASAVPNDPAVFGVFVMESSLDEEHWYQAKETDRFGVVNALGEGRVWVCNANGPVRVGDYITTSAVPGYAQKQNEVQQCNFTLGKVIEAVDWDGVSETVNVGDATYAVYLIAVVYTSG